MSTTEAAVRSIVGSLLAALAAWLVWLGIGENFDFGWFFIAAFVATGAYVVWPKT